MVFTLTVLKNREKQTGQAKLLLDFDLESYTLKPVEPLKAPVVNREDF